MTDPSGRRQPIVRHPSLHPFSRDHLEGLRQARLLRLAAPGDAAQRRAALAGLIAAWDAELADHFDEEERLLLPWCRNAELAQRLLDEHAAIRDLAARARREVVAPEPDCDLVARLGALLHDHIRWEEHVFFAEVERMAARSKGALHALKEAMDRIEASRPRAARKRANRTA